MTDFTYAKLKGRIVEKYGSQDKFAEAVNRTSTTVSLKLNNKKNFTQKEIIDWCELLDIDLHDVGDYFYS